MNDQVLEQQINIEFFVKLGKNASDACAVLRHMGKKKSSVVWVAQKVQRKLAH
jgi:hypothetical protein